MLYEKIYIKSEADYPKENGLYFCVDQNRHYIGERSFDKDDKINLHIWSGVDWYLQPVQQETKDDEAPKHPTSWRDFTINDGIFDEQETKQADIDDLNQYIINLLFSAYSDGKQGVTLDVFDRWLEEQMDHIDNYLKSQNYGNTKKK